MSAQPTPVDLDRVRHMLDRQNPGFIALGSGVWELTAHNARYRWNLDTSDVLQLQGRWRGIAKSPAKLQTLQRIVSRCNATRMLPKAYTLPLPGGHYGLMTECNILTNYGFSHEQFFDFCEDSMAAIMEFFDEVEDEFPEFVTWEARLQ